MDTGHNKSQGPQGQPRRETGANEDDMDISSEDSLNQQHNENAPMDTDMGDGQQHVEGGIIQPEQIGGMGGDNLQSSQMGGGNLQQEQMGGGNQQNRSVGGGNSQQEHVGGGNQQKCSEGGNNKIPQTHYTSAAFEDDQGQMIYKQQQQQIQLQKMRSLQASKQMIFGTFENIIGDLEELEGREKVPKQKKQVKKSNIKIPDQSKKKKSDVESIVEVQLRIFQTHLKACPKEIREEVRVDMINKTLNWCADREENHRPQTKTDVYAAKLYELLQTGQTSHSEDFQNPPQINEAEMKEAVSAIMVGQHQQRDLDESFKADPEKKAAMKTIRGGEAKDSGIRRIQTTRPDLEQSLQAYMDDSLR